MKKYTYIIFIVTFVCLMIPSVCKAATQQWSYTIGTTGVGTNYWVDQIVADGKGGWVAVWTRTDITRPHDTMYIARFDKKGNKLWEKSYTRRNVKVSYCNKKKVKYHIYLPKVKSAHIFIPFCTSPSFEFIRKGKNICSEV